MKRTRNLELAVAIMLVFGLMIAAGMAIHSGTTLPSATCISPDLSGPVAVEWGSSPSIERKGPIEPPQQVAVEWGSFVAPLELDPPKPPDGPNREKPV